jgi:hypothetical protein
MEVGRRLVRCEGVATFLLLRTTPQPDVKFNEDIKKQGGSGQEI